MQPAADSAAPRGRAFPSHKRTQRNAAPRHNPPRTTRTQYAPEHAAERAVVLGADLPHDGVHRPAVELLVRQHLQRDAVRRLVALDRLQRVVAVPRDALVDRQQEEVEAVAVRFVDRCVVVMVLLCVCSSCCCCLCVGCVFCVVFAPPVSAASLLAVAPVAVPVVIYTYNCTAPRTRGAR